MYALTWRELVSVARTGAYWGAAAAYIALLALFVMIWGDGMPIAGGGSNWQQFILLQWSVLTVVLPWTAARCHNMSRRELARLAMAAARPPSQLIAARCLAHTASLFALALFAMPMTAVMRQAAALTLAESAAIVLPTVGIVAVVTVVTTGTMLYCTNRLAGWVTAAVVTVGVAAVLPLQAAAAWLLLAAVLCVLLLLVVDSSLAYLPGEEA